MGADSATGTRVRRPPALAVLMGLLAVALALGVRPVRAEAATTINVTTTADGGAGSLRAAIATANADTGAVVISVPPGTYDLTAGVLNVGTAPGATISIVSSGTAANTVIRQTTAGAGVFNLDPNQVGDVAVTLQNLTITGGDAGGFGGGGILAGSPGDVLNVTDCIVTGNRTQSTDNGGGIGFEGGGTLNITGSTISNNTATAADGGGLFFNQSDALTISDSTFSGNQATAGTGSGEGAGIFASADPGNAAASESITGSALVDNQAAAAGGAIYFASGLSAISFDRIVGNSAASGSAIAADTAVTAANDWWGCNGGPGQSGCDTEADTGGSVTTSPFLVLTLQVAPTTVATGSGATATASLTQNSSGTDTAAQGHVPNGTPVTFAGTLGTVSPASGSTTSGAAVATFTAGASAGAGEVTATVDNQSVNTPVTIGSAPAVTSQPADQSVAAGQTATFAAAASGSPSPTVQWQVSADGGSSWSAISGATATSLSLTAETSENGNQYRAVFTNAVGGATSNAATLTIEAGPTVTAEPADQSVAAGQTATFAAAASGVPSPTVQWQVSTDGGSSWSTVAGATAASFSLTAETSENGNQYRAVFTNAAGSADSHAATLTVQVPPSVTSQPADQSVAAGQTATFAAAASGSPSPTVQWQVSADGGSSWSAISGATAASLRLTAAASENGNRYRAVFANAAGSAASNAATLTIDTGPTVTAQPADQSVVAGQTATFTAAASGSPSPTVQWQVSTDGGSTWSAISGATATSLRLTAAASENGNQYRAVFANAAGSAASNAAALTIDTGPTVTAQPADQSVVAGQTATFTAAASGSPSPTVQWQVSADGGSSWSAISGATATSLRLTAAASENGNQYRAVFANAGGSAASNAATLTMATGPTVTAQPADQSVVAGQTATFTATASGSPSPTVQWQVSADGGSSWSAISGATATSLRLTAAASENGNQYRAVFANAVGAADSGAATLTVEIAPTVSSQPADQSVAAGQTAIFTAAASGVPSPTVQWQVSTDGGSTWSAISGATATSLRLTAAASENGNQYRAVFTNAAGAADSNAATLTMEAAPTVMVQPADQTVVAGQTAIFTAAASGNPTPTVQWQVSTDGGSIWSPVSGATSTSLRLAAEASDNGNAYRAVFTNAAGSADSAIALLKVTGAPRPGGGTAPPPPGPTAPTVTSQPPPQTVPGGRAAVFTATAAGSPAPSVQWQVSSDGGVLWAALGGATFTTLRFQAVMADSGNLYRAVFTNAAGTVSSGAALLTVTSAASPAGPVTTPHDRFRLSGAPAGTAVSDACGGAVGLPAHEVAASCVFTVTGPSTHRPGTATLAYAPAILGALSPERLSVYARGADGSWTFVPTAVGAATDTVSVDVAGPGTLVVLADTRRFTDVPPAYWAARAIDVAGAAGIVNGMPQGTFRPGAVVTRADFVAMLARLQGVPPSPGPTPFADVPATTWYAGYVRAAVAAGWVRGTSATTFSPDAALTREQMAVLLVRALGLSGGRAPSFTDASAIAPWAAPAVRAAVAAGYLEGFPDGSFDPGGTATRAQAAAVVARVIAHRAPR